MLLNIKHIIIAPLLMSCSIIMAQEKIVSLKGMWRFQIGDNMNWSMKNYDDSSWEEIYAPSPWEDEGFNGYDGYGWYRKSVDGNELKGKANLWINLGFIDDVDQVYFNGHFIGYSGQFPPKLNTAYNAERRYNIPQQYVNYEGENVIAIRVYDTVLGGGIVSGDLGIYVYTSEEFEVLRLEGLWKFREGNNMNYKRPSWDDDSWAYLMAPGLWRYLGKKKFESYGWYRKEFMLSTKLENKNLTLILGKVDDFDAVYVNGLLIGSTNDGGEFGESQSYKHLRVYNIPAGILNKGINTLAVQVKDIGGHAGIYEGPLVILETQNVNRFMRDSY